MTDTQAAKAERIYAWEERAAILEFDGGMHRMGAENQASAELGYRPPWRGSIVKLIDAGAEPAGPTP